MTRSLSVEKTPQNAGFLREDAVLSVLVMLDQDDCSAARPDVLFDPDPEQDRMGSALGFLTPFRCFEHGIECDTNGRSPGPREGCVPLDEDLGLLHPLDRYRLFLETLVDPVHLVVGAVAGPLEGSVEVGLDSLGRPELLPSCVDERGFGAAPSIRLEAFVSLFNNPLDMEQWAYESMCSNDFSALLSGTPEVCGSGGREPCFSMRLAGCRDGPVGTSCRPCRPRCAAFDLEGYGSPDQKRLRIYGCHEICVAGPCTAEDLGPCLEGTDGGSCECAEPFFPTALGGRTGCAPLLFGGAEPPDERLLELEEIVPRKARTTTRTASPTAPTRTAPTRTASGIPRPRIPDQTTR